MTTIDAERFRTILEEERRRVVAAISYLHEENPGSIVDETEEIAGSDNHLAETATVTLDREIDYTLEENSEHVLGEIDGALRRIAEGSFGRCGTCDPGWSSRASARSCGCRWPPAAPTSGSSRSSGRQATRWVPRSSTCCTCSSTRSRSRCRTRATTATASSRRFAIRSRASTTAASSSRRWIGLATIAVAALAADQLTKHVVASRLALDDGVRVLGPLSIHHVQNSGIAFGLFSSATPVVIVLTGLAVAWMLAFFARSGARHPLLPVSLGFVIGGSLSNLIDRVRLGHVTDFLDLRFWPAFNLADSFIVVGVAILLATLVAADREPRRPRRVTDAPAARS